MRVRTNKSEPGTRFYIIKIYYDTKGIENRCTALRMFSVKTLIIYSQSFTVTHLNSEKEKQG